MVAISSSDAGSGNDLGFSNPVGAQVTQVQQAAFNTGPNQFLSSYTVSLPSGIKAGNLVVVTLSTPATGVTGPAGWQMAVANAPPIVGLQAQVWYLVAGNANDGQKNFTFTMNSGHTFAIAISEWHSAAGWPPNPLDKIAQGNLALAPGPSTTLQTGTTPLTAFPLELWAGCAIYSGSYQQEVVTTPGFALGPEPNRATANEWVAPVTRVSSNRGSPACAVTVGRVAVPWAGAMAAFRALQFSPSSADGGKGSESQSVFAFHLATGADAGSGSESTAQVFQFQHPASSDAGSGSDAHAGPATVIVPAASDFGYGADGGSAISTAAIFQQILRATTEGFSLSRAAMLTTPGGAENVQLYAAQAISLVPNVAVSSLMMDDWTDGNWHAIRSASLTVTGGFMDFSVLSALAGTSYQVSGLSPADYYGLPLWTQFQHNKPVLPMAFRAVARDAADGQPRTLDFVLYKVQIAVLDFTGLVYKGGLVVDYTATVLLSTTDEYNHTLPGGRQEFGRILSTPPNTGTLGNEPLGGI